MSLIDKMKSQAEQTAAKARAGAQEVQAKAKAAGEEMQAKRELTQAYGELGSAAYALIEQGEISHPSLAATAARISELKAKLEAHEEAGAAEEAGTASEPPTTPAAS